MSSENPHGSTTRLKTASGWAHLGKIPSLRFVIVDGPQAGSNWELTHATIRIGTDPENGVSCPDFSKVAACFGLHYQRIEDTSQLDEGLASMLRHPGPVLCEIMGRADQGYIEIGQARSAVDRRLVRRPLEDQEPFLSRELFLGEMIIEPINQ